MSATGRQPRDRRALLPHQTALVHTVLNPESKRVVLLRGEVGLGKSVALIALAGRLLQVQPTARALFLVPGSMRSQFVDMLREGGTPTVLVDAYKFRELLDSTTLDSLVSSEFWPRGAVSVLSREFAEQPEVLGSLAQTRWDLVIVDEAYGFRGARAETLRRIVSSAKRVVLATAMQPDFDPSAAFSSEETTVVEWRRDQLVDADGKLLDTRPRLILHEVPFSLTVAEASLQEKVKRLSSVLNGVGDIIAKSLLRSLQSSPPALEGVLRRLMGKLAADEGLEQPPEFLEDEGPEGRTNLQTPPSIMDEVVKLAGEALESIDNVSVDSKLNAFGNLLNRVIDAKTFAQRICVVTDYIATLFYLAAALEDRGMACQLLHGGHRSVMLPLEPEVVLMATRSAVSEGLNLSEITDLVLYDVPDSSLALRKVLSRFDPLRRPSHLNVHALLPAGITDDLAAEHFRLLSESQA